MPPRMRWNACSPGTSTAWSSGMGTSSTPADTRRSTPRPRSCAVVLRPRSVYDGPRMDEQEPDREGTARDHHADHEDPLERAAPLLVATRAPHQDPGAIESHRQRDRAEDRPDHPAERDQNPERD